MACVSDEQQIIIFVFLLTATKLYNTRTQLPDHHVQVAPINNSKVEKIHQWPLGSGMRQRDDRMPRGGLQARA
jgi:hypothetical protein